MEFIGLFSDDVETVRQSYIDTSHLIIHPRYMLSPLAFAIQRFRNDIVDSLIELGYDINYKNENEVSPLEVACIVSNRYAIEKLLASGVNTSSKNNDGYTIFHRAAGFSNDVNIIHILTPYFNANAEDSKGNIPLRYACGNGNNNIVKAIINLTNNINHRNHKGNTVLHYCCKYQNFDEEVIQMVCKKGGNLYISNNKGKRPYDYLTNENLYILNRFLSITD